MLEAHAGQGLVEGKKKGPERIGGEVQQRWGAHERLPRGQLQVLAPWRPSSPAQKLHLSTSPPKRRWT